MSAVNLTFLLSRWTVWAPLVAMVALVLSWGRDLPLFAVVLVALCLAGAVLAAVHHAEVVAHRVGEPSGHWYSPSPSPSSRWRSSSPS
jgi:Ca2+:H+ antiporter